MIDLDNQTDLNINLDKLEVIASKLTSRDIELIITDNMRIQALNSEYRGKSSPTDVLSFPVNIPFDDENVLNIPLGSIVISRDYVLQKSKELNHTIQDELTLLFIHGLLHLLGFDHETDNGEMRMKEKILIETFHLPTSLIIRTKGV